MTINIKPITEWGVFLDPPDKRKTHPGGFVFEFLGYLSSIQNTEYNGNDLIPFSKPKFF